VFRRELPTTAGGEGDVRFSVYGLWGSGNVVAERSEVVGTGPVTAYTMWDGHAIFGPGKPSSIERFPAFVASLPYAEFQRRYRSLGDGCEVWAGDEQLGIGCEEACQHLYEVCPSREVEACKMDCAELPRAIIDCFGEGTSCDAEEVCGKELWELQHKGAN
jgi:hypothetical protein